MPYQSANAQQPSPDCTFVVLQSARAARRGLKTLTSFDLLRNSVLLLVLLLVLLNVPLMFGILKVSCVRVVTSSTPNAHLPSFQALTAFCTKERSLDKLAGCAGSDMRMRSTVPSHCALHKSRLLPLCCDAGIASANLFYTP